MKHFLTLLGLAVGMLLGWASPALSADLTADTVLGVQRARVEAMEHYTWPTPDCKRDVWSPRPGELIEYDDCTIGTISASSPVILWAHGGPGEGIHRGYYGTVRTAARHIQINQPGIGRSSGGVGWSPEQSVDDEAALLLSLGITRPVFVAGWSWGSTMSLLFAQRHPDQTRAVLVGGVWSNSRADVAWYMGPKGSRQFMPGLEKGELFAATGGQWGACRLQAALQARPELSGEYARAEAQQAAPLTPAHAPVSTRREPAAVAFAAIESDMMCRGERGQWQLRMRWPEALASVPLLVVQGRYDQICRPETAMAVYRTWPGTTKAVIWTNGGHWGGGWYLPGDESLKTLTEEQRAAIERQTGRVFEGGSIYLGIGIDLLHEGEL